MSRCFPFPPPGYEKKITTDEPDLLKKEKRKEKKHKKDKKDKHKKDGKEKKEKDRSEKKHKDKKEKHRDKKKNKEKDKTSTPDEKKINGQFEGQNGEIIHQNGDLVKNGIKIGDTENFKFVQELDRRIRDKENGTVSHQFVVNKIESKKTDGRHVAVPNRINGAIPPFLDNKRIEKLQEKESDDKRENKRKKKEEKSERKKAEKDKKKHIKKNDSVAGFNNLLENGFQGVGGEGNLKKRKYMETNGVSHDNEPNRPNKITARPVYNTSPKNGTNLDFLQDLRSNLLDKQGISQGPPLNNFKGKKVNGMIASQPVSVSVKKPPIPAFNHVPCKPSPIKSPPVITNHVAVQSPPVPPPKPPPLLSPPTTTAKQPVSRPKPPPGVVNKAAPPPPPKKKPPPPHPDTKYLNQILTVPKLDPWCGHDDQEWLFNNNKAGPTSKKTTKNEVEVQVWSEAKHIESVDVYALPYVIPY